MKVRCIETDTRRFPIDQEGRDYFGHRLRRHAEPVFDAVTVGDTYTVHAIAVYSGFPFYYVPYRFRGHDDWKMVPSLCFDVIDGRISKLWHFAVERSNELQPRFPLITKLAIKEWIDEPLFFERLVDSRERELRIFTEAAAVMNAE